MCTLASAPGKFFNAFEDEELKHVRAVDVLGADWWRVLLSAFRLLLPLISSLLSPLSPFGVNDLGDTTDSRDSCPASLSHSPLL